MPAAQNPAVRMLVFFALVGLGEVIHLWPLGLYLIPGVLAISVAAAGLALSKRPAFYFALPFFLVVACYSLSIGLSNIARTLEDLRGSDFRPVAGIFEGGFVLGLLTLGLLTLRSAAVLLTKRSRALFLDRFSFADIPFLLAGMAACYWSFHYQYFGRDLPRQSRCFRGQAVDCAALVGQGNFTPEEKREFSRRGCEAGGAGMCVALGSLAGGKQVAAVNACDGGNPEVCLKIGWKLLSEGQSAEARAYFDKACTQRNDACWKAARIVEKTHPEIMNEFYRKGCDKDHGESCIGVLRNSGPTMPAEEVTELRLKACLLTDVNECLALIRTEPERYCPIICKGETEARRQSCHACGTEAQTAGNLAQAKKWLGLNCERGYRLSCDRLRK